MKLKILAIAALSLLSSSTFADASGCTFVATCNQDGMKIEALQSGPKISLSTLSLRITLADGQVAVKSVSDVSSQDNGQTLAIQSGFLIVWIRQGGNSETGVMLGTNSPISCQILEKPFIFDSSVKAE